MDVARESSDARILIVDDDDNLARLVYLLLKAAGFSEVRYETDARKAFSVYLKYQPDLLVLDLIMPQMDGFEILAEVVQLEESPPNVLILTGVLDDDARRRAMQAGAREFLTKPFAPKELVSCVRKILSDHGQGEGQ